MNNVKTDESITLADGTTLTPVKPLLTPEQEKQLMDSINLPESQNYFANKMQEDIYKNLDIFNELENIPYRNPNEKAEQLLEEGNQTHHSIHYETKKTNAQLTTLLNIIDSQTDELNKLKSINQELQNVNNVLEEDKKHANRNSVVYPILTGVVLLLIEHWKDIYNFILSLIK